MKNRKLSWSIALMSLSLIGLMAIQAYWARLIILENERNFNSRVNDSMAETIRFLEKKDIEGRTLNFFISMDSDSSDSNVKTVSWVDQGDSNSVVRLKSNSSVVVVDEQRGEEDTEVMVNVEEGKHSSYSYSYNTEVILVDSQGSGSDPDRIILKKHIERARKKKKLIGEVWDEILIEKISPSDRLDSLMLDSILSNRMKDRGIDIPFFFGVIKGEDSIIISNFKPGQFEEESFTYQARLFPSDLDFSGSHLGLFFPDKRSYILKQSIWALISSGILIALVALCFWFVVRMFLGQRKLNILKNDFIDNMTHELKTPLANISLATESLRNEKLAGSEKSRLNYLDIIEKENRKVISQVEEVLEIKDDSWGGYNFKSEHFELGVSIRDLLQELELRINDVDGKVDLKYPASIRLNFDQEVMKRLIKNLLDNALKYSGSNPQIELKVEKSLSGLEIIVSDNGPGIPTEYQALVFDKFFRVPSGNIHDTKGSGLGLSFAKQVMNRIGGSIQLRSESGKGSQFSLLFPKKYLA